MLITPKQRRRTRYIYSDVTNPDMFIVNAEREWRLGWGIIELRYMADQLVCKDYDPSTAYKLTHSHTMTPFDTPGKQAFWKHCGKKRNCSERAISPLHTVFSTRFDSFLSFSSNLKLSSGNSFSLEESKICLLVMGYITNETWHGYMSEFYLESPRGLVSTVETDMTQTSKFVSTLSRIPIIEISKLKEVVEHNLKKDLKRKWNAICVVNIGGGGGGGGVKVLSFTFIFFLKPPYNNVKSSKYQR